MATVADKPSELLILARQLYARRASGIVVPYRMLDPDHVVGQCHNNVDYWAGNNPGWKSVRGWLVFDLETFVQFNPHSVLEDADGVRVDPTPEPRASQRLPFLQHEGTDDDFIRIVEGNWLISIHYDVQNDHISVRHWR